MMLEIICVVLISYFGLICEHLKQKSKDQEQILLELFPFVVLNCFLYRILICYYRSYTGQSTPTTAFDGAIWYSAYTM